MSTSHSILLNKYAFYKTVAAFHMCSLKRLFWSVWTSPIKMSVVVTDFTSVGERAFWSFLKMVNTADIFHYFFFRFQYKHLQVFLLIATFVKISKIMRNSVKWRQRFGKISVSHFSVDWICEQFTGSRKITPEQNCPPTPKLTLPLILTRGQFFSGVIVWLPPNPKINPNLDRNPNPNRGTIFLRGEIVRIPSFYFCST